MGLNLYFCECDMQFYLFILTGSHIYINVWEELPNIGFFLKNPNLLSHFLPVPFYISQIKTCHISTYLIKLVIFCISLFQLLKINIKMIKKKKKKKKKHPRPNNRSPLQLPPVHHHQSSLAELTRRLWRHQRSYPLPTDHTTQLIVFFESIKSTSTASLSSLKTLSSSKSHTSFSKSKDQKPTNVYIRSPTKK